MGFNNPVANAAGTLVRTVMKSFGFITGLVGWQISKDGNAEFNGAVFRGTVVVGPVAGGHVVIGPSGLIQIIGTGGGEIDIESSTSYPQLHFYSVDKTNDAFINAISSGSNVDLGINSGVYTPADGVPRRGRLFMADSSDIVDLAVIGTGSLRQGGWVRVTATQAFIGYHDIVVAGGPYDNFIKIDNGSITINGCPLNLLTNSIKYGAVQTWLLTHQDQYNCSGNQAITLARTPIGGLLSTNYTVRAGSKWTVRITLDASIGATNTLAQGELGVSLGGAAFAFQVGMARCSGVNTEQSPSQTWSGTFAAGGTIQFQAYITGSVAANNIFSPHTSMNVEISE